MLKNLFFYIALLVIATQCNVTPERITTPSPEESKEVVTIGNEISGKLLKSLKSELQSAMKEGGVTNAIEVCNLKAIPLTDMIANTSDKIISLKRTTYKFRNLQNAPNEFEMLALEYFHEQIESENEIPEFYTQKITQGDSSYFHFYKPLKVGNICLTCHGDQNTVSSEIKDQLAKLYPDDRAINYNEGDFRGLISVTIRE